MLKVVAAAGQPCVGRCRAKKGKQGTKLVNMARFFRRTDVRLAIFVYITCILIQSGGLGDIDCYRRLCATHAFWTSAPPVDPGVYPNFGIKGRGGVIQTWYGLGQSLVMLPADVIGTLLAQRIHGSDALKKQVRIAIVAYLTFPVIDTMAIIMAFHLLRALQLTCRSSMLGALGLLTLTSFLHYSQNHQENNLMLFCTLGLYWSATKWLCESRTWPWAIVGAFAAGFNLLIRVPTILDFGGLVPFVICSMWRGTGDGLDWRRKLWTAVMIGLPILSLAVLIDRLYQFHRFGTFYGTYLSLFAEEQRRINPMLPADFPFSGSFSVGFFGPFVSLRKSIFLYDPTILLGMAGLLRFLPASRRRQFSVAHAILIGTFIQLLLVVSFYAKYFDWAGDVAWGDRFITVPLHIMCMVGIALAAESWVALSFPSRLLIAAICLVALSVQLASIVFLPALETEQESTHSHSAFIIGQRFENIDQLFTGKLQSRAKLTSDSEAGRPSLAPFSLTAPLRKSQSRRAIELIWVISAFLDGVYLMFFILEGLRSTEKCAANRYSADSF
jgi:hypothetical protein